MTSNITENNGAFIEMNATISHEGIDYSSGGAFLAKRVDTGKYQGLLYVSLRDQTVGTWDGSMKIPAHFGHVWQSNFGDWRQYVSFTHAIDGMKRYFYGVYMRQNSDLVYVYERSKW